MLSILSWNVRRLNDADKFSEIKLALPPSPPFVIYLQESKLQVLDVLKASAFLPATHTTNIAFVPSDGASGGLMTAWDGRLLECIHVQVTSRTLDTVLELRATGHRVVLLNGYGPCSSIADKATFLQDLQALVSQMWEGDTLPRAILGDFNLIRHVDECSNDNFDAASAAIFNDIIRCLALQDLPLTDQKFTWSNRQRLPILAKLDRFLVSNEWRFFFLNSVVTSFDCDASDHVSILLSCSTTIPRSQLFRFNNHWVSYPSYLPLVNHSWENVQSAHPELPIVQHLSLSLSLCLKRSRADLKAWSRALR